MQAIILAAGQGKRLRPVTLNRSKAMLPVLGKPIVERVVETLSVFDVEEFIIVVNPNDREILQYFDKNRGSARVRTVFQPEPVGMADALRHAADYVAGDFILSACDTLLPHDSIKQVLDAWKTNPKPNAVLSLIRVTLDQISGMGSVNFNDPWITQIIEKPLPDQAPSNIASLPLYCFSPIILDYLDEVPLSIRGEYELQDVIQMLIVHEGLVRGVIIEHRLSLTKLIDLLTINRYYLSNDYDQSKISPHHLWPHAKLFHPVYIEVGTTIGAECVIGPEVYVEHDCSIGDRVTLRESVLLRGSRIPDGASIIGQVIDNISTGG